MDTVSQLKNKNHTKQKQINIKPPKQDPQRQSHMKKKISEGALKGLDILQKKYQAEYAGKEIESVRKLVTHELGAPTADDYGLNNKKIRVKKNNKKKGGLAVAAEETLEKRRQSNSKLRIDIKTPLLDVGDTFQHSGRGSRCKLPKVSGSSSQSSVSSSNRNTIHHQTNNQSIVQRGSRLIRNTAHRDFSESSIEDIWSSKGSSKSIGSHGSRNSTERSSMMSIVNRLSKGDGDKEKYLIEICRQNLNEQLAALNEEKRQRNVTIEQIHANNPSSKTSRESLYNQQRKKLTVYYESSKLQGTGKNSHSQQETATCTRPVNSMETSGAISPQVDTTIIGEPDPEVINNNIHNSSRGQSHKIRLLINPNVFSEESQRVQGRKRISYHQVQSPGPKLTRLESANSKRILKSRVPAADN